MKVCLVDPIGTGHHVEYVKAALTRFEELGVQVHFIGAADISDAIKENINSYTVLEVAQITGFLSKERNKIAFVRRAYDIALQQECELIHFLYLDRHIRALYFSGCIKQLPIVATLHWGYMISSLCQTLRQKAAGFIDAQLLKNLSNAGLYLCVHSEKLASMLPCRQGTVSAINYPIQSDYKFNEQERSEYRAELDVGQHEKLLLCFGGTRIDKGADKALKALAFLSEQYKLLIIGAEQDILYSDLATLAKELGIQERVILKKEFVDDDKVNRIFSAADCLLLPYDESFSGQSGPLTIAAAIGVPVVASKALVLEETITKFELGNIHQWGRDTQLALTLSSINSPRKLCVKEFLSTSGFAEFSRRNVAIYQNITSLKYE
ncbi:glycosyltransferase family 4 protein [Thalassotalea euphylliae]|uniref:Glycosyltransferase n=1 Tax=Thalassotalea euphylliae TaxID=1655234 RepID=A0A3E0U4L8_9GAMM|nr:glycosyltransferase family 4 protein [Thalassotalea euphylliae]REL31941.1 glycosyltransferase [Thalassotalea euphylliae]